jgi:transposase-like protein
MPSAAALPVPPDDLASLRHWATATQAPAVLVQRAKLLLLAAEGASNTEIAERLGVSRPTVIAWRKRSAREGLTGRLADQHRRGRPQTVRRARRAEILATTLSAPPQHLGVTHWSSRLLATTLGVSHSTVARVWAEHDLKPWLARHPRIRLHFTPTHASWLNLVEVFFAIIQRQALRRGDFASVAELVAAIGRFCDGWNQRCQPFTWTKDAEQILARLHR